MTTQRLIHAVTRGVHVALDAAADLVMPARCAGCDLPGTMLCDRCRAVLPLIEPGEACRRCGAADGAHGCAECGRVEVSFAAARAAGVFEWPLSRMVTLHKDAGELRLTALLAQLAADAAGEWLQWADALVPVPASPGAFSRRGFDHGERLCAELARIGGVCAMDALRARPRRDQRHLSREARAANALSSLRCPAGISLPGRLIVVDDVMTTCATAEAATRALLERGANEVRVVCVARASGGKL